MGEQSSIAGGGREIVASHNMRDVTQMAAAWYSTRIGGRRLQQRRQDNNGAEGNGGGSNNGDGNNPEGRRRRVPPQAVEPHDVGGW